MITVFRDRAQAGELLANRLLKYSNNPDVLVLALTRGGVPVAYPVAYALKAPLDVIIVRKLGVPGCKDVAMGAISAGNNIVFNSEVLDILDISDENLQTIVVEEQKELEKYEYLYRGNQPALDIQNKIIILIDDGIVTGTTIYTAIKALKQLLPARIVVAIPTSPPAIFQELHNEVDEVICLIMPEPFDAIGLWYYDFAQISDTQVLAIIKRWEHEHPIAPIKAKQAKT